MALRFLHARCEGLGFRADEADGEYHGASLLPGQIPYNMQMDVNRLCLERELEKFIGSGAAEDAYTVYYCYLEMFFGHYGKSKKMVELLSEFESNGSSLLMKHRDHYSHSVYVFALGLAIYESNTAYRAAFKKFYGFDTDETNTEADHAAASCFLEYWGLTALFHDIGKVNELSDFPENDYTDEGQLLGHIVMGTIMVDQKIKEIPGFPKKLANELKHCIVAHHGELEYGSPKKPALIEALALNYADNTDAKMESFMEALAEENTQQGEWRGYNKLFESNIRETGR
jgi:hypothetical protein